MLAELAADTRTTISCDWMMIRDAFALDPARSLVPAFQECYRSTRARGCRCRRAPSRSSTTATASGRWREFPRSHTARAGGQHTVSEWVEIDDLVRVAKLVCGDGGVILSFGVGDFIPTRITE